MSVDIEDFVPAKDKAIVGLIGSVLTYAVPYVVQAEHWLPAPWPTVVGGVIAVLTFLGIIKAKYAPEGSVLVPAPASGVPALPSAVPAAAPVIVPRVPGARVTPWG